MPDDTTPATPGQAARKAWGEHWAAATQRGRGKPGYDSLAYEAEAWEAAAEAATARHSLSSTGALMGDIVALREQLRQAEAEAKDWALKAAQACNERDAAREERDAEAIRFSDLLIIANRDRDDAVTLLDGCQRELGLAVDRKREAEAGRDAARTELAIAHEDVAILQAQMRNWPTCPNGCSCRVGTDDADHHDCACYGPCCMGWEPVLAAIASTALAEEDAP